MTLTPGRVSVLDTGAKYRTRQPCKVQYWVKAAIYCIFCFLNKSNTNGGFALVKASGHSCGRIMNISTPEKRPRISYGSAMEKVIDELYREGVYAKAIGIASSQVDAANEIDFIPESV